MNQTCPKCHNEEAINHTSYGLLPGKKCQERQAKKAKDYREQNPAFLTISMQDRIQSQRDHNGKDIIQPFLGDKPNPDFARAYPEHATEYFSADELKELWFYLLNGYSADV